MQKWLHEWLQNQPWSARGHHFWDFGWLLEGSDFSWNFDRQKVCVKFAKIATWGGQWRKLMQIVVGVGGGGLARRGFWSLRIRRSAEYGVWFDTPFYPQRGAADLNAPCGASTAAPSLCRSAFWCVRLLQLLALCKTLNCRYAISLLRFLKVFGSSWLFVAVAWRSAICKFMF